MFSAVPPRYDLVNRVITLGLDACWRRAAVRACLSEEPRPRRVLDLCCGTGDLSVALARAGGGALEVTGVDYSPEMLELAARKARRHRVPLALLPADAAELPFDGSTFDSVTISFGFRNLSFKNPHADQHVSEILRVLRPGGRLVIVESSQPRPPLLRALFGLYLSGFVYPAGALISGNRGAYRYLAESVRRYFTAEELCAYLLEAGFAEARARPLFLGAASIHVARRPR
jgi:demethylmenaquinone methyltransferase / 2-methoxy-6-polyprenyl-1,4-benzoquinol methylase